MYFCRSNVWLFVASFFTKLLSRYIFVSCHDCCLCVAVCIRMYLFVIRLFCNILHFRTCSTMTFKRCFSCVLRVVLVLFIVFGMLFLHGNYIPSYSHVSCRTRSCIMVIVLGLPSDVHCWKI